MSPIHSNQGISTLVNHVGEGKNPLHAHVTPIFQTSTFSFPEVKDAAAAFAGEGSGYLYTRLNNPNQRQLALKIAALEGYDLMRAHPDQELESLVDGIVYATGMAAITSAILGRVKGGDTVIAQKTLYSATYKFFQDVAPTYGIQVVWMEDGDLNKWAEALRAHPEARLVYLESPANPTMSLVDIESISKMAHQQDAWVFVDNTFASPYCQRPLTLGADVVMHSTTKYIGGHGNSLGGIIVDSGKFPWADHKERYPVLNQPEPSYHGVVYTEALGAAAYIGRARTVPLRNTGSALSPFNAFLILQGLETLALRMERHCDNAIAVAKYLQNHPKVEWVNFAALPEDKYHALAQKYFDGKPASLMTFGIKGGFDAGIKFYDQLQMIKRLVNIGDAKSLACHPASTTHRQLTGDEQLRAGVRPETIRISVGIEHIDDIIADLEQAFAIL